MDKRKEKLLKACKFHPMTDSTSWRKTWGDTDFFVDSDWDYDKLVKKIRDWGWLLPEFIKPELPPQPDMQKIFFDAEFTGLHRDSTLISIALITEDDHTFYAEFTDFKERQCTPWIQENVIKNLKFNNGIDDGGINKTGKIITCTSPPSDGEFPRSPYSIEILGNSKKITIALLHWLKNRYLLHHHNQHIQFITDCYAYDWMLLVDLLTEGKTALDMPEYLHYIPIDISTLLYAAGVDPDINREKFANFEDDDNDFHEIKFKNITKSESPSMKHNSLWDAFMIRTCFNRIRTHKVPGDLSVITYN